jgi:hypothetical protein
MSTKREQILARIMTNLIGTVGVSTRIYRSRVEALARSESPAIIVEWTKDECDQEGFSAISELVIAHSYCSCNTRGSARPIGRSNC